MFSLNNVQMKRLPLLVSLAVFLGIATLSGCRTSYHIQPSSTSAGVIALDSTLTLAPDSVAIKIITPYRIAMESEMNEVLAYAETALMKGQPESALGNFVSEIVLSMATEASSREEMPLPDFCVLNNGGLRSGLPKGEIRTKNVFELMPFENRIVILEISGSKAQELFDFIAREGGIPVAGMRMGIKDEKAVNVMIGVRPFDPDRTYRVATSDYLADGGDDMFFFRNPLGRTDLNLMVRDAIIDYLRRMTAEGKSIQSITDKRVYYEQ